MARKRLHFNVAKFTAPKASPSAPVPPVSPVQKINTVFRMNDISTYNEKQLRKQIEALQRENRILKQQLADERKTIAMTRKALNQRIKNEGREQLRSRVQKATMGLFNGKRDPNAPTEKFTRDLAKTTGRKTTQEKTKQAKASYYDVGPFQDWQHPSSRRAAHMMIQKYPILLALFQKMDSGVLENAVFMFYAQYHRDELYDAYEEESGSIDEKDYQSFLGGLFSVGLITKQELEVLLNEIVSN